MRTPEFYAAVFGIIRDTEGKILFSRRHNTGHLDGYLSLPAGHVEKGETPTEAMRRELKEEVGIEASALTLVVSQQSMNARDDVTYHNFYFEILGYTGNISNMEENVCSELGFRSLDDLAGELVVPYVFDALMKWKHGDIFSEIVWNT